ncbi:hypothetical protein V8E55_001624 [Tylopilus felleus]
MTMPKKVHDLTIWKAQRARAPIEFLPFRAFDAIVSRLAQQDKVPWYCKPHIQLFMPVVPTCLGLETIEFDTSMINSLQAVSSWLECNRSIRPLPKTGKRYPILLGGIMSLVESVLQGSALNCN